MATRKKRRRNGRRPSGAAAAVDPTRPSGADVGRDADVDAGAGADVRRDADAGAGDRSHLGADVDAHAEGANHGRDPAAPPPPAALPRSRRARLDEAPKAPWSPFPLVELTILAGIVLLILGLVGVASDSTTFIFCGLALVGVATLELSVREHFAGYRSHSSLLSGAAVVLVVAALAFFTDLPRLVLIGVGVVVFGVCFLLLRSAFQRRTGGLGFRA